MEYTKILDTIQDEERYWIKYIPRQMNPIFFVAADDPNKVFVFFDNGMYARSSLQMAMDFGYDPNVMK